jgi:amino acid permease
MGDEDVTDEVLRKNRIEHKKLELEYVKVFLTFCSIVVAVEVFIIGNTNFDATLKTVGLLIMGILLVLMGIVFKDQLKEIKRIFYE